MAILVSTLVPLVALGVGVTVALKADGGAAQFIGAVLAVAAAIALTVLLMAASRRGSAP
ncbi:hypothetical protein [uncultured Modestobacter sp.]|uniref:hypothetical protein n=1 Tax=uncultured Modestobacter sp. TaxID=380048 RepID=UPI00262B2B12|nr:hypothetical protein [uncultured Modestobacter sp.]